MVSATLSWSGAGKYQGSNPGLMYLQGAYGALLRCVRSGPIPQWTLVYAAVIRMFQTSKRLVNALAHWVAYFEQVWVGWLARAGTAAARVTLKCWVLTGTNSSDRSESVYEAQ